jgi:hypothetical protein
MDRLLAEAQRAGFLRAADVSLAPVAAHALVYGLAGCTSTGISRSGTMSRK